MNDDFFTEENLKFLNDYSVAQKAFDDLVGRDHTPMEAYGIIMGMVANNFRKFNYKKEDFKEFLECICEIEWPDNEPPKGKHLKLVK